MPLAAQTACIRGAVSRLDAIDDALAQLRASISHSFRGCRHPGLAIEREGVLTGLFDWRDCAQDLRDQLWTAIDQAGVDLNQICACLQSSDRCQA